MFCKSLLDDRLLDSCSFFHSSSFRLSCASSFSSPTLSSLPSPFSSPTSPFLQLPPLNFALPFLLLLPPSLFPCLSSSIFQRIRLCLLPHHSVCLSFSVFSSFFSTSVLIYTLSFILTTLRFRSFFSNASHLFILFFLLLTHFSPPPRLLLISTSIVNVRCRRRRQAQRGIYTPVNRFSVNQCKKPHLL